MTVLTEKTLHGAQDTLRKLINLTGDAHAEMCDKGLTEQRDLMREVQAHLLFAEAKAGGISLPGDIQPKSGGK